MTLSKELYTYCKKNYDIEKQNQKMNLEITLKIDLVFKSQKLKRVK